MCVCGCGGGGGEILNTLPYRCCKNRCHKFKYTFSFVYLCEQANTKWWPIN